MHYTPSADIWFGPGGTRGVFGAGVAFGLQQCIEKREIGASSLRLYGSSVGCLTAAYLATGNTACGLSIFREDAASVVAATNLLPLFATTAVNRLGRLLGCSSPLIPIPQVLKVETVVAHMLRRTPGILAQLRRASVPVFAEYVDRRSGEFCHVDLRTADDPLYYIRGALNLVPFTTNGNIDLLDSNIKGYGFSQLLRQNSDRRIVAVLNQVPNRRLRNWICSRLWAVMSGDSRIARLYAHRDAAFFEAARSTEVLDRALLVTPDPSRKAKSVEQSYEEGVAAARRVVDFVQSDCARSIL